MIQKHYFWANGLRQIEKLFCGQIDQNLKLFLEIVNTTTRLNRTGIIQLVIISFSDDLGVH